jgi:predicted metal-binding membrane protein
VIAQVRAGRTSLPIIVPIVAAWAIAVVAQLSGSGILVHHDTLIESGLPLWFALLLFVFSWQAMIVAMMLPSSLPMIRLFAATSSSQPGRGAVMASFLTGYAAVWTAFGVAAFGGDVIVHRLVDHWDWLAAHSWFISAGVLALAGAFQFSPLKDACLSKCRLPAMFLLQRYRRGITAAYTLGRDHGLFCLGCCWALMLVAFAAGFASLWWMAALTALMVYEKIGTYGKRIVPAAGFVLIAWAILIALHPAWLPPTFSGR